MCRVKITIRGDSRRAGVVENALRDLPGLELFSQDKHADTNMKTKTDDLDSNYSNTDDGNTDDGNTDVLNDDYDRQLSSFSSPPQACPFTMSDFDSDDQDQLHTQQDSDEDLDRTPLLHSRQRTRQHSDEDQDRTPLSRTQHSDEDQDRTPILRTPQCTRQHSDEDLDRTPLLHTHQRTQHEDPDRTPLLRTMQFEPIVNLDRTLNVPRRQLSFTKTTQKQ